jgi:hypothetical protein
LLSQEALPSPTVSQSRSRSSLFPLLVALFAISYTLLVLLVVEQNSTITNQRWLIKQLFADSSELSAMKAKAIQKRNSEPASQAQASPKAKAQTPSTQVPSEESAKTDESVKPRRAHPEHPPKPASDSVDARRALIAI